HVGHADVFERAPHDGIDTLPVHAHIAVGLDAAGAGLRRAFGQAERLLFEGVDDLRDIDLLRRTRQRVAAAHSPAALDQIVLAQQLEDLAGDRLPQAKRGRKLGCAEKAIGLLGHVGQHQGAVIDEFADTQHEGNLRSGTTVHIVLLWYYIINAWSLKKKQAEY